MRVSVSEGSPQDQSWAINAILHGFKIFPLLARPVRWTNDQERMRVRFIIITFEVEESVPIQSIYRVMLLE